MGVGPWFEADAKRATKKAGYAKGYRAGLKRALAIVQKSADSNMSPQATLATLNALVYPRRTKPPSNYRRGKQPAPWEGRFTFYYGVGKNQTVTVRAKTLREADRKAREVLDARCVKRGEEPPVGWSLTLGSR